MTEKKKKSLKVNIIPSTLQLSKSWNKQGQSPTCSYSPCCQNTPRKGSPKTDDCLNKKQNNGIFPNPLSYLSSQYGKQTENQQVEGQQAQDDPDL